MNISLDYDRTYTADPALWDILGTACSLRGHKVWIVTARPEDCPIDMEPEWIEGVIYTSGNSKKDFVEDLDLKIDVWIDDDPGMIVAATPWNKEEWNKWRKDHGFKEVA